VLRSRESAAGPGSQHRARRTGVVPWTSRVGLVNYSAASESHGLTRPQRDELLVAARRPLRFKSRCPAQPDPERWAAEPSSDARTKPIPIGREVSRARKAHFTTTFPPSSAASSGASRNWRSLCIALAGHACLLSQAAVVLAKRMPPARFSSASVTGRRVPARLCSPSPEDSHRLPVPRVRGTNARSTALRRVRRLWTAARTRWTVPPLRRDGRHQRPCRCA
jgi:hypothetical protein